MLFNQVVALFIGPDGLIFSCPQCSNMGSGAQVEFERMFHNFMPSLVPQMKEFQSNLFCLLTSVSPTGNRATRQDVTQDMEGKYATADLMA